MIGGIKERLAQLVEVNQALAHDLDLSRRVAADLGRERDSLRDRVEALEKELRDGVSARAMHEALRQKAGRLQSELTRTEQRAEAMRHERDAMLCDAEAARMRAARAEEQAGLMAQRLSRLENERDDVLDQLEESSAAMDEIRSRLAGLAGEADGLGALAAQPCLFS